MNEQRSRGFKLISIWTKATKFRAGRLVCQLDDFVPENFNAILSIPYTGMSGHCIVIYIVLTQDQIMHSKVQLREKPLTRKTSK